MHNERRIARLALLITATVPTLFGTLAARADDLDLGDMVVGGDGTGTGQVGAGMRITTATLVPPTTWGGWNIPGALFTPTAQLPFVDGLFLPDETTQIDSSGATFDFPDTEGSRYDAIRNAAAMYSGQLNLLRPIQLPDQPGVERRGIGIHANAGITYDLDAIRAAGNRPRAVEGVAGLNNDNSRAAIEAWILVDGELRFHAQFTGSGKRVMPFSILLAPRDRFLTFASTDFNREPVADHAVFADAVLVMGCRADLDGDGDTDLADLGILLANFGMTCP